MKNKNGFGWIGWILVIAVIIFGAVMIKKVVDATRPLGDLGDTEDSTTNVFFSTEYVGTYYGGKPATTQNCTKTNNNYNCKTGTNMEFYVGIINKGEKKRYFYPAPCIIKDYSKGDTCRSDNAQFVTSYKPCGVEPEQAKATECIVGRGFILETGTYRVYPGAKCLPEDCYDPTNPGANDPKVNYDSFFEITVK